MIPVNGVVCEKLSSLLVERMQRSSELRGGLNEGSNAVLCIRQAYVWLYARIAVQSFLDQGGSQLIYYFLESVAQRLDPQLSEA